MTIRFTNADRRQMKALGVSAARVVEQIETFRRSDSLVGLDRPCTIGDGVRKIDDSDVHKYTALHASAAGRDRFMKFVPASGAATRMFQSLLQIYYLPQYLERDELQIRLAQGVSIACDFKRFVDRLHEFPFVHSLSQVLADDGYDLDDLRRDGPFQILLEYLLTDIGLGYGCLPKAMLLFHSYPEEQRTAFEEQLAESAMYLGTKGGKCSVHFTVPEEHEAGFLKLKDIACRRCSDRHARDFDVSFSFQKHSTNTIAVDMNGSPFRDRFGRLHFRPAGHGALIENLSDLHADLIYIKNVDNVVPDRLKETVSFWKKVLGGCLVSIQEKTHSFLRLMHGPDAGQTVLEAADFASRELLSSFPDGFKMWPVDKRRSFLIKLLDRPIRVCGVVPNSGEPGGAPFWVKGENGEVSIQIVEKAQVDLNSPGQNAIWNSSTHFNPVDIVCCTRDFEGNPFDLKKFVDPKAVIISRKSKDTSDIQALELPGLWNGGMADWITLMIEVPPATFNPVKSVYDLLRPEHQPERTCASAGPCAVSPSHHLF
jgi:hypothetical protein